MEMATPTVADKSYAAAADPKRATKSVAINIELIWQFSEAKYKTLSDIEKTEKQLQKAAIIIIIIILKMGLKLKKLQRCPWILKIYHARRALVSLEQTRTPERYFRQT